MLSVYRRLKRRILLSRIERDVKFASPVAVEESSQSADGWTRANWFDLACAVKPSYFYKYGRGIDLANALTKISRAIVPSEACITKIDVRRIETIAQSTARLWHFRTVEEFGAWNLKKRDFLQDESSTADKIRACKTLLERFLPLNLYATDWDPRIGWRNNDGSHRMATLVALAMREKRGVFLPAQLTTVTRDISRLQAVGEEYRVFAVSQQAAAKLYHRLRAARIYFDYLIVNRFVGGIVVRQGQSLEQGPPPMLDLNLFGYAAKEKVPAILPEVFSRLEELNIAKDLVRHLCSPKQYRF